MFSRKWNFLPDFHQSFLSNHAAGYGRSEYESCNLIYFNVGLLVLNILEISISRGMWVKSSVSVDGRDDIYLQRLTDETWVQSIKKRENLADIVCQALVHVASTAAASLKCRFLGFGLRGSYSVNLVWGPGTWTSNLSPRRFWWDYSLNTL